MPKTLFPHQRIAIKACVNGFKDNTRGQVIMACGTGKTLVGIRVPEALNAKLVIIFAPSIGLIAQLIRDWREDAKCQYAMLAVCSDGTVSAEQEDGEDDSVQMSVTELERQTGIPVTTDPDRVAKFIRHRGPFVVFCTYASSGIIQAAQHRRGTPAFDLAIADEAHRCASHINGPWSTIVRHNVIRAERRLFMTATPRVFRPPKLNEDGKPREVLVASMDDVNLFGPEFYKLNFMEAIRKGLLCSLRVVVSVVTNCDVVKLIHAGENLQIGQDQLHARDLALHVAVHKAMIEHRLSKVISFHSRVFRAKDFAHMHGMAIRTMRAGKKWANGLWTGHVSARNMSQERLRILTEFAKRPKNTPALLTNAQCLTEGVDVPAVDGVVFADPRESVVAIVQAIGRAMRKSPNKQYGTIVVPVFCEEDPTLKASKSEVWETVFNDSSFQTVRRVFLALRMADDQMDIMFSKITDRNANIGTSTGNNMVRPRMVPDDEGLAGIKAGKMVEAPIGQDIVDHVKNGRVYDKKGREIIIRIPDIIQVLHAKGSIPNNAMFTSAIVNRLVRWNVTSLEEKITFITAFLKKHKRMPSLQAVNKREQELAGWANAVRAAGRAEGFK